MANQNMNDPENPNKRLRQDDVEIRKAAFTNGTIVGIVLVLVLIVIIGYIYLANNRVETEPATNTVQQAPATAPVGAPATTATPPTAPTNSINNTNNEGSAVNGATAPTPPPTP